MSRKRKADRELPSGHANKRTGNQTNAPTAQSAFAAKFKPGDNDLVEYIDTSTRPSPSVVARGTINLQAIKFDAEAQAQSERHSIILSDSEDSNANEESNTGSETSGVPDGREAFAVHRADESDGPVSNLMMTITENDYPRSWKRAREIIVESILKNSTDQSIVQITGTTNAGKATFAKFLFNTVLDPPDDLNFQPRRQVAVLDLDPTKSEFSPPGHVALVLISAKVSAFNFSSGGAGMLSSQEIIRSHAIGLHGQQEECQLFLSAISDLLECHQKLGEQPPLFICGPSFERESERGTDNRTTEKLTELLSATHICCLAHAAAHTTESIEVVRAAAQRNARIWQLDSLKDMLKQIPSPEMMRDATLSAYFHSRNLLADMSNLVPLHQYRPYGVSYTPSKDFGAVFVFGDLPPNHPFMLSRILNGSVVSIVLFEGELESNDIVLGQGDGIPYFILSQGGNPRPIPPSKSHSVGLGLVRSIDHKTGMLHILTPDHVIRTLNLVPSSNILLVYGVADSPGWAYEEGIHDYYNFHSFGQLARRKMSNQLTTGPLYLGRAKRGMKVIKSRRFKKKI